MSDASETSSAHPPKAKRERLTYEQRLARIDAQKARILSSQKNESRRLADRRKIIVGATVINAMENDAELHARICALLDLNVTRDVDRKAIQPWLSATSTPQ